jgi:hypothetical protein
VDSRSKARRISQLSTLATISSRCPAGNGSRPGSVAQMSSGLVLSVSNTALR